MKQKTKDNIFRIFHDYLKEKEECTSRTFVAYLSQLNRKWEYQMTAQQFTSLYNAHRSNPLLEGVVKFRKNHITYYKLEGGLKEHGKY